MEITEQEAFKLGFLARCAEEKLAGAELDARLSKIAEFNQQTKEGNWFTWSPVDVSRLLGGAAKQTLAGAAAMYSAPFGLSIAGGGLLGYGAGKAMEPNVDDDALRAQELATTYKLYAEKAKNRKKLRRYRLGQDNA